MSGLRVVAMAFPAIVKAGAGSLLPRIRGSPGFWLLRIRGVLGFWLVCGLVFFSDTFLWRAEEGLSLDGAERVLFSRSNQCVRREGGLLFFWDLSAPAPGRK